MARSRPSSFAVYAVVVLAAMTRLTACTAFGCCTPTGRSCGAKKISHPARGRLVTGRGHVAPEESQLLQAPLVDGERRFVQFPELVPINSSNPGLHPLDSREFA